MSVLMAEESTETAWDVLLRAWQQASVPDGWRAEILGHGVTMTPPPGGPHNLIAHYVHEALLGLRPNGCGVFQTQGVAVPTLARLFIPDLAVIPISAVDRAGSEPVPAEEALIAVEITSQGNADRDRVVKLHGYAHGGVPLYLLIDAFDPAGSTVTLYANPVNGQYRHIEKTSFGEPVKLPEPVAGELDTIRFPVPPEE